MSEPIDPEPPTSFKKAKWLLIYGKTHKLYVFFGSILLIVACVWEWTLFIGKRPSHPVTELVGTARSSAEGDRMASRAGASGAESARRDHAVSRSQCN